MEERSEVAEDPNFNLDVDGDGKVSFWEANVCRICLTSAIVLAFGDNAIQFIS